MFHDAIIGRGINEVLDERDEKIGPSEGWSRPTQSQSHQHDPYSPIAKTLPFCRWK
ncbi:hypothetical protein Fmac_016649 [Flemingia macrophylla]|uniref:Uncharacterized protein n=1 Tax=Flemingia macrophylla TaxID=520843 RepID=A0ABD1MI18_9FABA